MARAEQTALAGTSHLSTQQKQIRKLENAADKYDEKRQIVNGLQSEMENIDLKIREIAHENEADLSHEQGPKGEKMLVYRRGDYTIVVTSGKEKSKVKIKDASQGGPVDDGQTE